MVHWKEIELKKGRKEKNHRKSRKLEKQKWENKNGINFKLVINRSKTGRDQSKPVTLYPSKIRQNLWNPSQKLWRNQCKKN